jgi:hemolysin activation/secretion protein
MKYLANVRCNDRSATTGPISAPPAIPPRPLAIGYRLLAMAISVQSSKFAFASILVVLLAAPAATFAQGAVDRMTPSAVVPKEAPQKVPRDGVTVPQRTLREPSGDKPYVPDQPNLKMNGIVIVKSDKDVVLDGLPDVTGIVIKGIPFLDHPDFRKMLTTRHLGRPLTENAIRDLEDDIIIYCRDRGKLLVDVILVEQTIPPNGTIQLWFLEGKVGKVVITNPGRKWFKDSIFSSELHLRPGESLDSHVLRKDLDWLNNNPFRQVDASFKPGDKLGTTDVDIHVDDRLPFRPYIGYENSGTTNTGPNRLITGFNWGNAFGLDHQLNYQYAMDVQNEFVSAHAASYIIPLPWRHTVMVYGSYVDARADAGAGQTPKGTSWQTSIRYQLPLPEIYKYRHELALGFDFKRGNNNLLLGETTVATTDVDIAQFALGYNGLLPDKYGKTSLGLEGYYSPGGMTSFNDDESFNHLRTDSKAEYGYIRANAERDTRLPCNFSWVIRGLAQWSSARLQPSEEIALGGYNTVRGYNERVFAGDYGYIINNELRTPPFAIGLFGLEDQMQFLGFFDLGYAKVKDFRSEDVVEDRTLYSAGVGVRFTVSRNFSLRFDYGVPLSDKEVNGSNHNVHLGAILSY